MKFNTPEDTQQSRLGFNDRDRRSKEHDEIVAWIDRCLKKHLFMFQGVIVVPKKIIWEKTVTRRAGDYVVGFIDLFADTNFDLMSFEAKTAIESAGEVLRQTRMYQTFSDIPHWFIVSPHTQWRETFGEQGVPLVAYDKLLEDKGKPVEIAYGWNGK